METDGCRGECASNRDREPSLYLDARCFARVEKICWSGIDVQLSRIEIAGEVRAAHAPVNPFSEGVTEVV